MARTRDDGSAALAASLGPWLFFAFVVVGCGYIIAAKFLLLSPFLVTSVPVVIMLAYAGMVKFLPLVRLRDDQAGDNLYYLGFLYTLTSLGVSLYQFEADGPAEAIVHNFGVAVGSTIAGVALRVLFNQMRRDPADVEHVARLELSESARRMRRELDATVVELAHFRRSVQQQVAEGFEHVRTGMEEVSGRILASFEEMTKKAALPFESASSNSLQVLENLAKTIGESLDASARSLTEENEKLAAGAGRVTKALEETSTRIAAMQTPDKVIAVQFEPIAASLNRAMEGFAEQINRKDALDREVIDTITRSGTQHHKQSSSLASLARAIEKRSDLMSAREERELQVAENLAGLLTRMREDFRVHAEAVEAQSRHALTLVDAAASLSAIAGNFEARLLEGSANSTSSTLSVDEDDLDGMSRSMAAEMERALAAPETSRSSFMPTVEASR